MVKNFIGTEQIKVDDIHHFPPLCCRKEIKEGGEILLGKIQMYKPKIAVFNGKGQLKDKPHNGFIKKLYYLLDICKAMLLSYPYTCTMEPLHKGHPRWWSYKRGGLSWGVK